MMCRRRPSSGTANPRGGSDPYLSSNNEHILDIKFGEPTFDPVRVCMEPAGPCMPVTRYMCKHLLRLGSM